MMHGVGPVNQTYVKALLFPPCILPSTCQDYFLHNMPWLMVPYLESARRNALSRRFGVIGIPTLVIISPEGEVSGAQAGRRQVALPCIQLVDVGRAVGGA
jgi:hypothetical protein